MPGPLDRALAILSLPVPDPGGQLSGGFEPGNRLAQIPQIIEQRTLPEVFIRLFLLKSRKGWAAANRQRGGERPHDG